MSVRIFAIATLALATFAGCDRGHDHAAEEKKSQSTAATADHDHEKGAGGDHAHAATNSFKPLELGTVTIGAFSYTVTQTSALAAGKEVDITLVQAAGTGDPKAIRLWIGTESAQGSIKTRTHKHGDKIEAHVKVPDPLPAGGKLWIEFETDQGKSAGPLEIKP